jgi:aquaporin Z
MARYHVAHTQETGGMNVGKYLVEFIGAFFLVFTIGMVVIDPGGAGAMAGLAVASVLMVMVYAGGHVSGAHYNPAVTLAVFIRGKCPAADVVPYIIAQCLAAAAAGALVLSLKQGEAVAVARVVPVVIIGEGLFTFALCWVVLNVATAKSNAGNSHYGLAIGFTVLAGVYAVGPVSGAAFNPAVVVGAGVMGLIAWADAWPHLVGEAIGAIGAALAFKAIVKDQG